MNKKKQIIIILCPLLAVLLLIAVLAYLYNADTVYPDLMNYYDTGKEDAKSGLMGTIVRNSKALFGKKVSEFFRWRAESNFLKTVLNEDEIINKYRI